MNMQKNSQSGFGVVEVLLLLIIVGIIGFTGWRVYEANKEVSQIPADNSKVETKEGAFHAELSDLYK